jgi:hypothetical protein
MEKEEVARGPAYLRNVESKIKIDHRIKLNNMNMQTNPNDFVVEIYEGPKPTKN